MSDTRLGFCAPVSVFGARPALGRWQSFFTGQRILVSSQPATVFVRESAQCVTGKGFGHATTREQQKQDKVPAEDGSEPVQVQSSGDEQESEAAERARFFGTPTELVDIVARRSNITKRKAREIIYCTFEAIVENVSEGRRITFAGFGSFSAKERKARRGRNPRTGEEIHIPESRTPSFAAGKFFQQRVKSSFKQEDAAEK